MLLNEYDKDAVAIANAAYNRILKFNLERQTSTSKRVSAKGLLFHYTGADGLKGIIGNNELWATSAYFLNDSSEISYGCGVLKEALDFWLAKNPKPQDSLTIGMAGQLREQFGEAPLNGTVIHPIYLACFCEDDNLLSQWRTYGQSGGYSLGFAIPARDLVSGLGFKPEPNIYTSKWVRVEYDRTEQVKNLISILDALLPIFDDPDTAKAIKTIGDHSLLGYPGVLRVVGDLLLEEIMSFKNEAFSVEREWRIAVRRRELLKQGTDDGGKTPLPVHFRSSKGTLVPYVKLVPTDPAKKLPIACVRCGPTMDKTTATMAVRMMLDKHCFSNVRVLGSDIPVRF